MQAADHLISVRRVTKTFPGAVALADVSLDVVKGELHAIVGENGAGKSTLMKILAGVIPQYQGDIVLRDAPIRFRDTRDAETAGVSIIHQELNLVDELSVAANIFLGRELRTSLGLLDNRRMEQAAGKLLAELQCAIAPHALVGTLRVGDQQLVEIAKALSLNADVLIMDEPTSALTEAEVARLFEVIQRLRRRGVTILYISHKMDEVFRLADRITVLRDGSLIKTLVRRQTTPRDVTHLMVGREIEATHIGQGKPLGDVVLRVKDLSLPMSQGARGWRLREINFELRRGEILGVAGLMGAGRTELLEALFGASPVRPTGEILLDGQPMNFRHPAEATQAGIALVTEDRKRLGLFSQMTVGDNITICTLEKLKAVGLLSRPREQHQAATIIRQLGIRSSGPAAPITSLSGGNQQKAIIGRWLLTQPRVLLLDDPTRGIDVGAKAELYRLMDELCRSGLGIVVTSSELPELLAICDRILVLCEGRQTGLFSRAEVTEQHIIEAATRRDSVA